MTQILPPEASPTHQPTPMTRKIRQLIDSPTVRVYTGAALVGVSAALITGLVLVGVGAALAIQVLYGVWQVAYLRGATDATERATARQLEQIQATSAQIAKDLSALDNRLDASLSR